MEKLRQKVAQACRELFGVDVEPELSRPDEQFGDFATNVALKLAGKVENPPAGGPRELAKQIAKKLQSDGRNIAKTEVAGPGFINITLTDEYLFELLDTKIKESQKGKEIIVEFSDPNPFKELHVGHLYDSVVGDSIANLLATAGAAVHRVNFGGDVGLHVAKSMWSIVKELGGLHPEKLLRQLADGNLKDRASWLSARYVEGSKAYENDEEAQKRIIELNQKIYKIHEDNDHESPFAQIYWTCRQWSYDYFNDFYGRMGIEFEKYYPESITAPIGLKAVKEQQKKGIFEKSDGAVVFKGETHTLHTRVFINSKGLPTYETKDIGLALCKWKDYKFDKNIILTGDEIIEYMKVVLAALGSFEPEIAKRTTHLTHGMVRMRGGAKMSSRKGDVVRAVDVLDTVKEAAQKAGLSAGEETITAAVKYDFLKQRYVGDIMFDPDESVSLHGNSGPYLQYAHARARSILAKAKPSKSNTHLHFQGGTLEMGERRLVRKIGEFAEVVDNAVAELMPHYICTYLYELAQEFNRFYEKNRVIGDERQDLRLGLVAKYADVLKNGLSILGISAPEKM